MSVEAVQSARLAAVQSVNPDAPAGVLAAHAGGMQAVGIARLGDEALLEGAGADLVVTSLDQVDTAAVPTGTLRTRPQ